MRWRIVYDKLMVVAHPDDESIFGGANLIQETGWKVICLTNGNNETRSTEFYQAMDMLKVSCEIWDYPDDFEGSFDAALLKKDLKKILRKNSINCIVTHNLYGEYGHSQHKSLSQILHNIFKKNLYVFDKGAHPLPFRLLKKKLHLLSFYQSQMEGNIEQLMDYVIYERLLIPSK